MDIPSPARMMVELQKAVTRGHRMLLQSPLAPLVSTRPWGRFLILETTGRRSREPRRTPLSYTRDGDSYIVIASDGGSPKNPDWFLNVQADPRAAIDVRADSGVMLQNSDPVSMPHSR